MKKEIVSSTPVMKQYMDIKSEYKKEIVLFRMGDFYETFLDEFSGILQRQTYALKANQSQRP